MSKAQITKIERFIFNVEPYCFKTNEIITQEINFYGPKLQF